MRTELAAAETPQQTLHRRVRAVIQNLTEDLLRFVADNAMHKHWDGSA